MIHFSRSGLSTFRVRNVIHFPGKEYDSLFWVRTMNLFRNMIHLSGSEIWLIFSSLENDSPFGLKHMIHLSWSGIWFTFLAPEWFTFRAQKYDSPCWVRNTNESLFGSGIWPLFLLRNMNPFPGQTKIRFSGSDYDSSVRAITLLEVTVPFLSTKIWTFVHIRTAALTMSWFMSPACYIWSWPIPYCCMCMKYASRDNPSK